MKAIVYLRVSTKSQGQSGLGLEAQREAVRRYLGDTAPLAEFIDVDSGARADRPELEKALTECELTGAVLLVATLSRLSRDVAFLESVKLRCAAGGFEFKCADMPEADSFMLGIMAQVAQYERQLIGKRTRDALAAARARGTRLGSPCGVRNFRGRELIGARRGGDKSRGDANAWAEKRRGLLEELRAAGLSLSGVARELTSRGITTRRGGRWHARTVANLISRLAATA